VFFFKLGANTLAFESAQVIYEELAIEMVNLMLDANRKNAFCGEFEFLSLIILGPGVDGLRPGDGFVKSRYRQTALVIVEQVLIYYFKTWINKYLRTILILRYI
jgi:hypothetical protein